MWHKVAKVKDVESGRAQVIRIGERDIALFNLEGNFFAMANVCPHRGGPLAEGHVNGKAVTCPWHAWEFDIPSGACNTYPGTKQPVFPVKIENGDVFVEV